MKNHEAGIKNRVSECVYPADLLSDPAFLACSGKTRGSWMHTLFILWKQGGYEITYTKEMLGRIWGYSTEEVEQILTEMLATKICDVTLGHENVTLLSRRLSRRHKAKEQARLRKEKERKEKDCHADVPAQNPLPSIPISSPSSISTSTTVIGEENIIRFESLPKMPIDKKDGTVLDQIMILALSIQAGKSKLIIRNPQNTREQFTNAVEVKNWLTWEDLYHAVYMAKPNSYPSDVLKPFEKDATPCQAKPRPKTIAELAREGGVPSMVLPGQQKTS